MSKDKKKKQLNVIEFLHYTNITECALVISRVNPYMKSKSSDEIMKNMTDTVTRTIQESNSAFVVTAGWLATIEKVKKGCYYVDFYVDAGMVDKTYLS